MPYFPRSFAAAALAAGGLAMPASAVDIEIQLTGLDLFMGFDGKRNIQTGPVAGSFDDIDAATFFVDGVSVGTIVGNIRANLGIPGFNIPSAGGVTENQFELGYFNIDFDTDRAGQGFLNLDLGSSFIVTAFYTGNEFGLSLFGRVDQLVDNEPLDRVPNFPGFSPDDTITFSFVSTNLSNVEDGGNILHRFQAKGTGNINGTAIPEPASLAALGLGGLIVLRRRR